MSIKHNLRVLVAPLDWGLGHSTRCIPIIQHLLNLGCSVFIASEGHSTSLLQSEFPDLRFLPLQGYRVRYSNSKRNLPFKILCQIPKILKSIRKEHEWLKEAARQNQIDLVISDNRFGLWHSSIPAIFITHQLGIKVQYKWLATLLRRINYKHINRFTACWIPDFKGSHNLAGQLSHPASLPAIPVTYIGTLSRFNANSSRVLQFKLLIVLSGPEPQRSIFEQKVLAGLQHFKGKALLVRGLPASTASISSFNQVVIYNHLPAVEMEDAFASSEVLLSRPGYTTVMDAAKMGIKPVYVPTPGQTEQEYLGNHLHRQKYCVTIDQDNFDLANAIAMADTFDYQLPDFDMNGYTSAIEQLLNELFPGPRPLSNPLA